MKTPDYMSYNRYKKSNNKNPKNTFLVFITTFFVTLLIFTAVAKHLSPDVDVTIGDSSQTEIKETGLGVKRFIDERLKMIQMEDNSAGVSKPLNEEDLSSTNSSVDDYSEVTEEKMNLPSSKKESQQYEDEITLYSPSKTEPPRPKGRELNASTFKSPKMMKILVGHYTTIEQAEVAQEILFDSGLDVTPFIKKMGNYYTLQVGSYFNKAKADAMLLELLRYNYPAKMIVE